MTKTESKVVEPWHVYILETIRGMLYIGITNNIDRRMAAHRSGRGAQFTKVFGFKQLLYSEIQPNRVEAMRREIQLKRWTRPRKLALIAEFSIQKPRKKSKKKPSKPKFT